MIFLNGALLAFLGALGLPLLLHLLSPRRRRARELSTLRFLKEIESTRLSRLKLRRWLLLLVRTALLAAIVLAFARPVGSGAWLPGERPRRVALLVDDSASSRLPGPGGAPSGFDAQRADIRRLLEELGPDDEVLWASLAKPVRVHGPESPEAALRRLEGWEAAASAADAAEGLRRVLEAAADWPAVGRELHLFGDLRLELPAQPVAAPADWRRTLHPAPVDDDGVAEWGRPELGATILKAGEAVELRVPLAGAESRELRVELELDGEVLARSSLVGRTEPVRLPLEFRLPRDGWLTGGLRLSGDGAPGPGELPIVLDAPRQRRVLLAGGDEAERRALRAALRPDERYGRDFRLEELPLADLDRLRPEDSDLAVVIVGAALPDGAAALLAQARGNGLGVWLLPGRDVDLRLFGRLAEALGLPAASGLAPGGPWRVGRLDAAHAVFHGLFDDGASVEPVGLRRLLVPGAGADAATSLAFADDGRPLLLAGDLEGGRTLWLATGVSADWSDLARSGLLAPMMQRGLRWLAGADLLPPGATVGEPSTVAAPGPGPVAWRVDGPGGGRPLLLDERGARLRVPPLPEAGLYRIHADGVDEEGWLAVRPPERERLRPALDGDELAALGGQAWSTAGAAGSDAAGREASGALLALAALLLAIESWLATGGRAGARGTRDEKDAA